MSEPCLFWHIVCVRKLNWRQFQSHKARPSTRKLHHAIAFNLFTWAKFRQETSTPGNSKGTEACRDTSCWNPEDSDEQHWGCAPVTSGQSTSHRNYDCTNSVFLDFIERSLSYHICRIRRKKKNEIFGDLGMAKVILPWGKRCVLPPKWNLMLLWVTDTPPESHKALW